MNKEKLNQPEGSSRRLLSELLKQPLFGSAASRAPDIGTAIYYDSLTLAKEIIRDINQGFNDDPESIVQKIMPRAETWGYRETVSVYETQNTMEALLLQAQVEEAAVTAIIEETPADREVESQTIARQWWANVVGYETRAALKRQKTSAERKAKYQKEIAQAKIRQYQKEVDEQYGDVFNRMVCQRLDSMESANVPIPRGESKLSFAGAQIESEIVSAVTDEEIIEMISKRESEKQRQRLQRLLDTGLSRLGTAEKALSFAGLMYQLDRMKTDDIWGYGKFQDMVLQGLSGNELNLVTVLCTINEFDFKGSYLLNPDIYAYKTNSKVEPVPLIVDELASVLQLFRFYGLNSRLAIYVADTDYTEIGANGPVTKQNLDNLAQYMANLQDYIAPYDGLVAVGPISSITENNPIYQTTKQRVLKQVTELKDPDFVRTWYQKFEDDVEKRNETIGKKKLFPASEVRKKTLEIARNIWAVNAAQGAVFSTMPETVLISTERRDRDTNYVIDAASTTNFPPVLYILRAAEMWNRKIVDKTIFEGQ